MKEEFSQESDTREVLEPRAKARQGCPGPSQSTGEAAGCLTRTRVTGSVSWVPSGCPEVVRTTGVEQAKDR